MRLTKNEIISIVISNNIIDMNMHTPERVIYLMKINVFYQVYKEYINFILFEDELNF